jgi:hypothetical protein
VGVEVQEPAAVQETRDGFEALLHQGAREVRLVLRNRAWNQSCRVCGTYSRNRVTLAQAVRRASMRSRTCGAPPQYATARSTSASSSGSGRGACGRIRQWCIRGKPGKRSDSTQLVVIVCTASSRQAPKPGPPIP